ncbi:cation:proton antiporter, partial [bacterium]|nr:cation:proton antiporter [bacterium]
MDLFQILAILITLAALFSYLNHRFFELPTTIGVMLIALVFSLSLVLLDALGLSLLQQEEEFLARIDFNKTLLDGMLSFLLFAGAIHVDINDLARQKWVIGILATGGVISSTFLIGSASWLLFGWFDFQVPFIYCLLFGALISPTDPIAVLGILKTAGAPKNL